MNSNNLIKYFVAIFLIGNGFLALGQGFNMTLEGSWDNASYEFNDCWGYTDENGNEYAIIGSKTTVIFFDITIPTSPVLLTEITGAFGSISGANSVWRDFKTYDRYAYAVADQGSEGLMVFDLTDISNGNVTKVNQLNDKFTRAHNIFIDVPEGKLYALGPSLGPTPIGDIIVYDIEEDPSNPTFLADVSVNGGYIHDAYVKDNILYASSGNDGLYIFDMTIPSTPVELSNKTTPVAGYNHSGWPFDNGNKMLVAEEVPQGLKLAIFDVSNLNNISFISDFRDPINTNVSGNVTYHNPYMVGDLAVVSSYQDGITIMDLTNTAAPFRAAHYDTHTNTNYSGYQGNWGAYPYFPSGTIIGSDISTGLYVLSTTLTMTNTCTNGVQDDFEIDVDCGGFCNTCECSAPTDLTIVDANNLNTTVSWTAVNTAVDYELRYRTIGSSTWSNVVSTTTSITLANLSNGVPYEFQIRANCGNRNTPYGTRQNFTPDMCPVSETYTGPQAEGDYETSDYIISSANIIPGNEVSYFTGDSILLQPNFCVDQKTIFLAQTSTPCGVSTLTSQTTGAQHQDLDVVMPIEEFTLVENEVAGLFYIVSNMTKDKRKPYIIYVLDDNNNVLESSVKQATQTIVKYKSEENQKYVHVLDGNEIFKFSLNK